MDLTIALQKLRPAVTAAKKLTGRAYVPELNAIRLTAAGETLHVESTDLEVSLSLRVPATVREGGSVLVDGRELAAVLKGKGSVILSDAREGFLRVENGVCTDLATVGPVVLPTAVWDDSSFAVDLATVAEVAAAAGTDLARPILNAVYFHGSSIVATDSYRLHVADGAGADVPPVLVPARAFAFLPKSGRAYLTTGKLSRPSATPHAPAPYLTNVVRLETASATVTATVVEGTFPNYRPLIPTGLPHAVTFEREQFCKVVAAVAATIPRPTKKNPTYAPLRFRVEGSELVVYVHGPDGKPSSSGRIACKGDDLDMFPAVAFNPGFIVGAVSTLRGEYVTLSLADALKPASLSERSGSGTATRVVMPVRV